MNAKYVNLLINGFLAQSDTFQRQVEIIHYLVKTEELGVKEFVYLMQHQEKWRKDK